MLREALDEGNLDQVVASHGTDAPGDEDAFNRASGSMSGKSKGSSAASKPDRSDD